MKPLHATKLPECIEGPEAYTRFEDAVRNVLTVPHALLQKQIEEHRKEAAANPNKRGPKPKAKSS
jgi:hypothetical protein